MKKKGLRLSIYRSDLKDCSNNGVSSKVNTVTLVEDNGRPVNGPFEPTEDAPAVKIVRRQIDGEYLHVEPCEPVPKGMIGYMAGGTLVDTHDSRFPSKYALSFHDRVETVDQYRILST